MEGEEVIVQSQQPKFGLCPKTISERFTQAALGHKSRAIHRAYSKNADVTCLQDSAKGFEAVSPLCLCLSLGFGGEQATLMG